MPSIPVDDTPLPPERPLLRQPVAFAWSSSTSEPSAIDTYQVTLPSPRARSSTIYLPGQAPITSHKTRGSSRATKSGGPSKKRRIKDYAGQTNRFRLDLSANTQPLAQHGDGSCPSVSQAVSPSSSLTAGSPDPTLGSQYSDEGSNRIFQAPISKPAAVWSTIQSRSSIKTPKSKATRAKTSISGARSSMKPATTNPRQPNVSSLSTHSNVPSPSHASNATGYYRRDYDTETVSHEYEIAHPSSPSMSHHNPRDVEHATREFHPRDAPSPQFLRDKFSGDGQVAGKFRSIELLEEQLSDHLRGDWYRVC